MFIYIGHESHRSQKQIINLHFISHQTLLFKCSSVISKGLTQKMCRLCGAILNKHSFSSFMCLDFVAMVAQEIEAEIKSV